MKSNKYVRVCDRAYECIMCQQIDSTRHITTTTSWQEAGVYAHIPLTEYISINHAAPQLAYS